MLDTNFSPWPLFSNEEINKVKEVLLSNRVNYWTGTECRDFEKEFADFCKTKYAVALSNGTLALDAAMIALGISKGDEVIVTSRSFIASVSSIINIGATPIFVDICPNSQNITSTNIKEKITQKTKAILCVHLAGFPCEMNRITKIAKNNNIFVIEDCAQAHGASYRGKPVGSIGDIGCWSFCQDKIMSTGGEGGMITTNSKNIWNKIWSYKDHGKSFESVYIKNHPKGFKWVHDSFGTNWRMTEIQACIGRIQLKLMPKWTKKRNDYQNHIWEACRTIKGLRVPKFNQTDWDEYHQGNIHAAYKCYIFVEKNKLKSGWSRDRIIDEITSRGVPCYSGSCSEIYLEKAFDQSSFRPKKRLLVSKELGETSMMFLIHPSLTKDEIELTTSTIEKVMSLAV